MFRPVLFADFIEPEVNILVNIFFQSVRMEPLLQGNLLFNQYYMGVMCLIQGPGASGLDQNQDLSIWSLMPLYQATVVPPILKSFLPLLSESAQEKWFSQTVHTYMYKPTGSVEWLHL